MAERLRRWTANPLGSARAGSNPVVVVFDIIFIYSIMSIIRTKKGGGTFTPLNILNAYLS